MALHRIDGRIEPVKLTKSTRGSLTSCGPMVSPKRVLTAPSGTPASITASISHAPVVVMLSPTARSYQRKNLLLSTPKQLFTAIFALARTVEYFRIPRNVITLCLGKSTYARCGMVDAGYLVMEVDMSGAVTSARGE